MKYMVTLDKDGHYVVKSLECVDAPPRYFWDKLQRCNCWERIADERICYHEIKLHGHFVEELYLEQHFRRSKVGRSFDGCEEINPDVLDQILRHNECPEIIDTGVCEGEQNDELCGEHDVDFVIHRELKKPDNVIGRTKPLDRQHLHNIVTTVSGKYTELLEDAKFKLSNLALDMQSIILKDKRKKNIKKDSGLNVLVPKPDMIMKEREKGQRLDVNWCKKTKK